MWTLVRSVFAAAVIVGAPVAVAYGQSTPDAREALSAVVKVKTFINPDASTIENLGRERIGSGIVIDHKGLIVTIGYVMVEAYAAEITTNDGQVVPANIVGYDPESGFGLLQAISPLHKVKPLTIGSSAAIKPGERMVAAGYGGAAVAVEVAAKREFAGGWEYLLDDAIFTTPPHPLWSGAALIDRAGKLVGVGSLIVADAAGDGSSKPGNMFVPIALLPPILGDLIADGHSNGIAAPWLGVTTQDAFGRLVVTKVSPGSPAEKAGVQRGDIIAGVNGDRAKGLADFYRKLRSLGAAGVDVPLDVEAGDNTRRLDVKSINRLDGLKLKSTF
jgi:S1-C subfamily serine protease